MRYCPEEMVGGVALRMKDMRDMREERRRTPGYECVSHPDWANTGGGAGAGAGSRGRSMCRSRSRGRGRSMGRGRSRGRSRAKSRAMSWRRIRSRSRNNGRSKRKSRRGMELVIQTACFMLLLFASKQRLSMQWWAVRRGALRRYLQQKQTLCIMLLFLLLQTNILQST